MKLIACSLLELSALVVVVNGIVLGRVVRFRAYRSVKTTTTTTTTENVRLPFTQSPCRTVHGEKPSVPVLCSWAAETAATAVDLLPI
jgi:hypothetical protein